MGSNIYAFELPTTGSLSFSDHISNGLDIYTTQISGATQARANLRAVLKESRHTDGDKDYLRLVKTLEEYLPYLYAIVNCLESGDVLSTQEPVFSWRTTLSAQLFNNSPRLSLPSLSAELVFTLVTYGFALSNLARLNVAALGSYERERGISDVERKAKDEKLGFAVAQFCKASGVFEHVSTVALSNAEQITQLEEHTGSPARPPKITSPVNRLALAAAQALAIRKLLTKSSYDNTVASGPPFPASHPSPALLAKLHLEASALYASADTTWKSQNRCSSSRTDGAALHGALARKWLGADAGVHDALGVSVGFLTVAKRDLEALRDGNARPGGSGGTKEEVRDGRRERRERIAAEAEDSGAINDSVSFLPVPSPAELQAAVPAGRLAVAIKAFAAPLPAFGPDSLDVEDRESSFTSDEQQSMRNPASKPTYAGAGSYF
ncbi:hypothetical protein EDB89DRAFT_2114591 [Lactarius sanguifluus]|nr:hypothetical protein EDB89DRAFT_2114591 [Lactarius sanguifluus]